MKRIAAIYMALLLIAGASFADGSSLKKVVHPVTLDVIGGFIKEMGYSFDKVTSENPAGKVGERIVMDVKGKNGEYTVGIEIFEDVQIVSIYVEDYLDLPLEEPSTLPMLSYLMNQNWKLTFGNFAWNISTGKVRFCHTLPIDDGISAAVFGAYLSSLVGMADEKYPEYLLAIENFKE